LIEVLTLHPDQEHRSQKHIPIGIQRIQESAAVVVLATMPGVMIVPVFPVAGKRMTAASKGET